MMINAESLIPLSAACTEAFAAKLALCNAVTAPPDSRTPEQIREFNAQYDVLEHEFQHACWLVALEVKSLLKHAPADAGTPELQP